MSVTSCSEEYPSVGGVPTYVIKYGEPVSGRPLLLVIPGNPGVAGYYDEFCKAVHACGGGLLSVWCVSHAGHGLLPDHAPKDTSSECFYDLKGQVKHKLCFVKEHIPQDTKLILVGHSIGAFMILQMLRHLESSKVVRVAQLFPTIEHIALSSKGQTATPILRYLRWLAPLPMYPTYYLVPNCIQEGVISWYFSGKDVPKIAVDATRRLADPVSIRNITNMANEEMQTVNEPDVEVIQQNLSKMMFYYGATDHWCPVAYYEGMKARFPEGDIRLCNRGYDHAFVLESSRSMAEIVWKWLEKCTGVADKS